MSKYGKKNIKFESVIGDLNEYFPGEEKRPLEEVVSEAIKKASVAEVSGSPPGLLTFEEAQAIEAEMRSFRERSMETIRFIQGLMANIDEQIGDSAFNFDISRKPKLKRATKKLFGYKSDVITYDMYKQALEMKAQLESEQAEEYK